MLCFLLKVQKEEKIVHYSYFETDRVKRLPCKDDSVNPVILCSFDNQKCLEKRFHRPYSRMVGLRTKGWLTGEGDRIIVRKN